MAIRTLMTALVAWTKSVGGSSQLPARERRLFRRHNPLGRRLVGLFLALILFPHLTGLDLLLADEVNRRSALAAAEEQARDLRTAIDPELPLARQYQAGIARLAALLRQARQELRAGQDPAATVGDLLALRDKLRVIQLRLVADLAATQAQLAAPGREAALGRQLLATEQLKADYRQLYRLIGQVDRAAGQPVVQAEALAALAQCVDPSPAAAAPAAPVRRALSRGSEALGAAAAGPVEALTAGLAQALAAANVSGAPGEADLAATVDIQKEDPAVVALAAQLGGHPVRIYEHLRNQFVYEPYYGSVKGAARTLAEQAGNDIDLASALMALYRASGIPCRYSYGTVELPAAAAAKWLGVDSPAQVGRMLIANGVPAQFDYQGDTIATVRVEHVWVKAHVAYEPYRGAALNEAADTWIDLDPSFKQNAFTGSRDVETAIGLHPEALLLNARARATIDPSGHYATAVPESYLRDEIFQYRDPVQNYLAANNLGLSSVFRQRFVSEEVYGLLPVSDQFKILARTASLSALPEQLQQRLRLELADPSGQPGLVWEAPLAALAGHRLAISYVPASTLDAQLVADYAAQAEFPACLVRVKPQLALDGQVVAEGNALALGRRQALALTFLAADGQTDRVRQELTAGGCHALVLDCGNVLPADLDAAQLRLAAASADLRANGLATLAPRDLLGEVLHGIGLSYFRQVDRFNQVSAGDLGVVLTRHPSLLRVSWDLEVVEQGGLPFTASASRVRLDLAREVLTPVGLEADNPSAEAQFLFTAGLTASAVEHNALSQALLLDAASSIRVLQAANKDQARIFTVTKSNWAAVEPQLLLPAATVTAIADAVNAGREVTVPERPILLEGLEYAARIERETATGAATLVLNGVAGGEQANGTLRTADLLQPGAAERYLQALEPTAAWLKVAESAADNAGLAYLPAVVAVNNWYAQRATPDPVTTIAAAIVLSEPITRISQEPAILNVTAGPAVVSPNGDGTLDAISFRADVTRQAAWTLTIRDPAGYVVASQSGSSAVLEASWSGPAGNDGTYTWELAAQQGETAARPVAGSFTVDTAAPVAVLSAPLPEAVLDRAVAVRGTALDPHLSSWSLALARDGQLTRLAEGQATVLDSLLAVLDVSQFANGPATLIFVAVDTAGNPATATVPVVIANPVPDTAAPTLALSASNPADGQPLGAQSGPVAGSIPVLASASDDRALASVTLKLDGQVVATQTCTPGQTRANLNASVDTLALADGPHTLTASATDTAGNLGEAVPLAFLTSSPISNFRVSPAIAVPGKQQIGITATLKTAASWTLSFSGPAAIAPVSGNGLNVSASLDASQFADGAYSVTLAVAGLALQPRRDFAIDLVAQTPVAAIASLANDTDDLGNTVPLCVREGLLEVSGTADDADVADGVEWRFDLYTAAGEYAACVTPDADAQGWRPGRVQGGSFGTLDFTLLRNGLYQLLLQVRSGGETRSASVSLALDSALKVGQFSFSEQDLVIPVAGMPITVVRTYDSLHPAAGEFGAGWTWALKDLDVVLDEERGPSACGLAIRLGGGRNLTLTLPDGRRATFACRIQQSGRFGYEAVWEAPPGVYATLRPTVSNQIVTLPGLFPYWQAAGPDTPLDNYDFPGWTLTLKDGTQYVLERPELGVCDQEDEEGNAFTVIAYGQPTLKRVLTRGGQRIEFALEQGLVQHYDAAGNPTRRLEFARDAAGRIVAVSDPARQGTGVPSLRYEYAGENLAKVHRLRDIDALGQPVWTTTEYLYENAAHPHYLTGFKDARGVVPMTASYDASGRLSAVTDAAGNRVDLAHDLSARSETIYDRLGNPTTHVYDARGNVVKTINALGHAITRTYDDLGHELTVTDPLGHTTARTYDAQGNVLSIADALGHTVQMTYDGNGHQLSKTDPLGNTSRTEYDAGGRPVAATDALGNRRKDAVDVNGNVTARYDALGRLLESFAYDANGVLTGVTDAAGFAKGMSFDPQGRPTGTSYTWVNPANPADVRQVTTRTLYDESGLPVESINALGQSTRTIYNALGKAVEQIDQYGHSTYTVYDLRGNVIETTDALGNVARTVYDAEGRVVAKDDPHQPHAATNGSRTLYDRLGRVVRRERLSEVQIAIVDDPANPGQEKSVLLGFGAILSATTTTYDAAGRVGETTNAEGYATRFEYDVADRQVATIDALGHRSEIVYDAAGRMVLSRDALGRETRFVYDALGRNVKTVYADGGSTSTSYNELGQRVASTDAMGRTRRFEYDVRGALVAVELPEVADPENGGARVSPRYEYVYDTYGRMTAIRDAKGRETRFSYDEFGRQTSRSLPLGQAEQFYYDEFGRDSYRADFKGQIAGMAYDSLGRVAAKSWYADLAAYRNATPAKTITPTYDDAGRTVQLDEVNVGAGGSTATRTTVYAYDREGRLLSEAKPEGTIQYAYDPVTQRHVRTWTANSDTAYAYDELGRLKTVTVNKRAGANLATPEVTTYSYNEVGSRARMVLPNGVQTAYAYDPVGRLVELRHTSANGALLADFAYTLRPDGRRAGIVETLAGTSGGPATTRISYTYDELDRLVREASENLEGAVPEAAFTTDYAYDLVGNRLRQATTRNAEGLAESVVYGYNSNDQLVQSVSDQSGQTGYGYDANGSLIAETNATTGKSASYGYNLENRLAWAVIDRRERQPGGGWLPVHLEGRYAYDAAGLRVSASESSSFGGGPLQQQDRYFLIDAQNPTGYAQVLEEHRGGGTGLSLLKSYTLGDDVLAQSAVSSQGPSYLLYDGHGSTRLLADASATITARYRYDAYGKLLGGNPSLSQPPATDLLYSGEQWDAGLSMQYLRARYYQPETGTFNRLDPYSGNPADPQSLHKYAYCASDPVNASDPSGMFTVGQLLVVLGAIAVIGGGIWGWSTYSRNQKAKPRLVTVTISVDTSNLPGSFNPTAVQDLLQSQLDSLVFSNLVSGQSVKIVIAKVTGRPATLGWSGSPKASYSCYLHWDRNLTLGFAYSQAHITGINPDKIPSLGTADALQLWVNFLAHESIWLNAGDRVDNRLSAPAGDISSSTANVGEPFTVTLDSRASLLDAFQLTTTR